ncbi:class F sortase [Streptomyces mangrovisoli]|uniref:Class F sortase n=1 Tax=Streptomyces mangrovisoli TaxID=1428628 RepID=A0A1J4NUW4_9ACTN|nr:class F sortase [Streptomyces mangrovisoli]OIJ66289.1 hypothetical protein WN71_018970 [Streptomyces mangrovisoli]
MARRRRRRPWYRTRLYRLTRTAVLAASLVAGGVWWADDGDSGAATAAPGPARPAGAPLATGSRTGSGAASGTAPDAASDGRHPGAGPHADGHHARRTGAGPHAEGRGARRAGSGVRQAPPRRTAAPSRAPAPPRPLPRSRAVRLGVPHLGIDAPVIDLGLDAHHRMTAPPDDDPDSVGWFAGGPSPGEPGTVVLVGHRDTTTGPAVFAALAQLGPGRLIEARRADGRTAVYTVDAVRTFDKAHFPSAEVYGARTRPELRLITCGGVYERRTGYSGNIVVFAHLTAIRGPRH